MNLEERARRATTPSVTHVRSQHVRVGATEIRQQNSFGLSEQSENVTTREAFAWPRPTRQQHPQEHTSTQHKPPSRLSTLRPTIGSGPHYLKLHVARSPTHAGLTKSYAHAPPTISTSSKAPMRRGVERRA